MRLAASLYEASLDPDDLQVLNVTETPEGGKRLTEQYLSEANGLVTIYKLHHYGLLGGTSFLHARECLADDTLACRLVEMCEIESTDSRRDIGITDGRS